ncbi:hypothetical protein J6590_013488 [Homalodisca vitripennis]|nr:hypothetical protein J6590_013488 [Homalodisca vitripennis]
MRNVPECGGTIISEKYILTAAHCGPRRMGIPLISVRLGEHRIYTNPDCDRRVCAPPVQDVQVEEHKCHENYDRFVRQNDICLLRMASPIRFNDFVSPICLPVYEIFQRIAYEGKTLEVAGWGIRDIFLKRGSSILQTIMVKISNHRQCVEMYKNKGMMISSNQICAGGIIGKDSCNGDSGGPLMAPISVESPPKYFIIGVVSFGPTYCADTDMPGVYTMVSDYVLWILNNIRE